MAYRQALAGTFGGVVLSWIRRKGRKGRQQVHVLFVCWQRFRPGADFLAVTVNIGPMRYMGHFGLMYINAEHHNSHLKPIFAGLSESVVPLVRNDTL